MTVLESILQAIRNAASYNQHELAAPSVLLWPDEEQFWTQCIELLRARYSNLCSLGEYSSNKSTGPAAWLRYQSSLRTGDDVPVIYLPEIGRSTFRSADQCPGPAKHLFALQFQGQFWTQKNGKDWTPFAFFSSADGGLGLDVAADQETKRAINECLPALLEVEVDGLRGGKLEAVDFRAIVTKDPARTLLRWMGDPVRVKPIMQKSGMEWDNFLAVCRETYQFDPEKDGAIIAAEKLTNGKQAWALVWQRYKEAPRVYPGIKNLLESLPATNLFEVPSEQRPLSNRKEEERLEKELLALSSAQPKDALSKLKALADEHAHRATWVWAELGDSPLARAIGYLRDLAETVQSSANPSYWEAIADYYSSEGWKADRNVLRALDAARSSAATKAVTSAIRAAYVPWLEKFATLTQSLATTYPTNGPKTCRTLPVEEGTVYLFADGLRMDLAKGLEERLLTAGAVGEIAFDTSWTALPTVTATAKPAWMPLAAKLGGPLEGAEFQSKEQGTGKALNHTRFKNLLGELGISFLESQELGSSSGCAWTELGLVDTYGHEQGAKLAWRIEEELTGLQQRIADLFQAWFPVAYPKSNSPNTSPRPAGADAPYQIQAPNTDTL
jgi:hypothetical protein